MLALCVGTWMSLAPIAEGQCVTCATGTRVDAAYNASATGSWMLVRNFDTMHAPNYNFSVTPAGGTRANAIRIPMADPTIVNISGTYYVTGTSDAAKAANFCIYKSTNLVDWTKHMTAFSESARGGTWADTLDGPFYNGSNIPVAPAGNGTITIGGVTWSNLWAPQLYIDPEDTSYVYLSFTGARAGTRQSCWVTRMSKTSFLAGGEFNVFPTPQALGYTLNDGTGSLLRDGGKSQGAVIPCTGEDGLYSAAEGAGVDVGADSFAFRNTTIAGGQPINNWLRLDTHVYWDAQQGTGTQRFMLYTWRNVVSGNPSGVNGNNVSAYPMRTWSVMQATSTGGTTAAVLPLGAASNNHHRPGRNGTSNVPLRNGYSDFDGDQLKVSNIAAGICEAPFAFSYRLTMPTNGAAGAPTADLNATADPAQGQYALSYIGYSRNGAQSPAYGIFYRVSYGSLSGLATSSQSAEIVSWEQPLVYSQNRDKQGSRGFGHGEVFAGPNGKPYLIFHGLEGADAMGNRMFTSGVYSGRTVYIKELMIDVSTGAICPFSDTGKGDVGDVDGFLVPWP